MPTAPKARCRWPGCPELQADTGRGYCAKHAAEVRRQADVRRGGGHERYGAEWDHIRRAVLARQPLCVLCEQEGKVVPATQVHHIRPRSEGGGNGWDNLAPLCDTHHHKLHGAGTGNLYQELRRWQGKTQAGPVFS